MPRRPIPLQSVLLNTPDIEIWPGGLLRARGNADERHLSRALRVLRRKRDGRYLAAELPEGLLPLVDRLPHEPGLADALQALEPAPSRGLPAPAGTLALDRLQERLDALVIDADDYAARTGLAMVAEPGWLAFAGFDRYRRALWLQRDAARGWLAMRGAALRDGVVLEAISGYRSHDYQLGIFARKQASGLALDEILAVNAAPGFSEHHSGQALDIGAPGEPPAEESFETTPAFAWLERNAAFHGFSMSYPRGNPHGITYEPWHWRHGAAAG